MEKKEEWKWKYPGASERPPAHEVLKCLLEEAPFLPGDSIGSESISIEDIPWGNIELIREGQRFVERNRLCITLGHSASLLYGFSFKNLTTVLLRTGGFGFGDSAQSMLRHVQTGLHIHKWYSSDFWDKKSTAFKGLQNVRRLHLISLRQSENTPVNLTRNIPNEQEKTEIINAFVNDLKYCTKDHGQSMSEDLLTYHPKVFISQYDMAMTQFGFIFNIFLFSKHLGINLNHENIGNIKDGTVLTDLEGMPLGLRGFLHMWAVLGKMLGIEDRFNFALDPNAELCRLAFDIMGIENLKGLDLTILKLQETYVEAITPIFKFITLKSALYSFLTCETAIPNCPARYRQLYKILSWRDFLTAKFSEFNLQLIYYFQFYRQFLNKQYSIAHNQNEKRVLQWKKNKRNTIDPDAIPNSNSSERSSSSNRESRRNGIAELSDTWTIQLLKKFWHNFFQPTIAVLQRG